MNLEKNIYNIRQTSRKSVVFRYTFKHIAEWRSVSTFNFNSSFADSLIKDKLFDCVDMQFN